MSMDRCVKCNRAVDTDRDDECYLPVGGIDEEGVAWDYECVCESCRDVIEAAKQTQHARKK
jgi:hypothetical protein